MLKKFNRVLKTSTFKNGIWLYILQIVNTVIPLLTLPYITRVLGPSEYGVFSGALNIIIYLQVLVEYGFNLTGVKKVALSRNKRDLSELYSTITISKLLIAFITFCLLIIIFFLANIPLNQIYTILILYSVVLGTALQQTWIFQGLEDMKYITITSVISRTFSIILIFALITNEEDLYLYSFLYGITYLLIGLISISIIRFKYKLKFQKISFINIIKELKEGWILFTTNAMGKIISNFGLTVLLFTATSSVVGVYSALYKIPVLMKTAFLPLSQILFPKMSKHFSNSFEEGSLYAKKYIKIIIFIFAVIGLIIAINSKLVVNILFGESYSEYFYIIPPLIIWALLSICNNLLGVQILVTSGHQKEYWQAFSVGIFSMILLNLILGISYGILGVSIGTALAEFILTLMIIGKIIKINKNYKRRF